MNKKFAIGIVVTLLVIAGVWYAYSLMEHTALPTGPIAVPIKGNPPALPAATVGSILAIHGDMLAVHMQGATTSAVVNITPATLIYKNGALTSAAALGIKETISLTMYPQAIGDHVAQTIIIVSTH
jgi:hypothetical protein